MESKYLRVVKNRKTGVEGVADPEFKRLKDSYVEDEHFWGAVFLTREIARIVQIATRTLGTPGRCALMRFT